MLSFSLSLVVVITIDGVTVVVFDVVVVIIVKSPSAQTRIASGLLMNSMNLLAWIVLNCIVLYCTR